MQQATGSIGSSVAAGNAMPPAAVSYVINLCASTTPVGLEQPNDPALKQFRFFVSRRREDGREPFRLHMGYFPTQEAAGQAAARALEDRAVLRLLESARPAPASRVAPRAPHTPSALPTPRAPPTPLARPTGSAPPMARAPVMRSAPLTPAARLAAPTELVAYAVQLRWSVQAIDLSLVPQLAIFAAYPLYGVEGNRDGRRWYGLRLGFFTHAVSAKQVAPHVRSEVNAVSIVPVTARQRERATAPTGKPPPAPTAPQSRGPRVSLLHHSP